MSKRKLRPLTAEETAYFCNQLAVILDSGVPVYDGLTVLAAETREKSTDEANALLDGVIAALSMDNPLYRAMEMTGVFPSYCIKTVMAGELSGRLDRALLGLAEHYEHEARIQESVRSVIISPIIMLIIISAVIAVLTLKVLPMFADIFADFDPAVYASISKSVEIAAMAGTVMLTVCGIVLLTAAVFGIFWKKGGAGFAAKFAAWFPLTRKVSEAVALSRFAGTVSMMISSGLSAGEALQSAEGISADPMVNRKISECAALVVNDVPFVDALDKTDLLPVFYAHTLRVSYSSGAFDSAWKKISAQLSDEADRRIEAVISAAEPVMTAIMTLAAGTVILTVMIPLMNIMTVIG